MLKGKSWWMRWIDVPFLKEVTVGGCGYKEADLLFPGRGAVSDGGWKLLRLVLRRGGFGCCLAGLGCRFCFPLFCLLILLWLLGLRVGA